MELLAAFAVREGAEAELAKRILSCKTAEEAVSLLEEGGFGKPVMEYAVERICYYMEQRALGKLQADCVIFANATGELARSKGVEEWFTLLEREQGRWI